MTQARQASYPATLQFHSGPQALAVAQNILSRIAESHGFGGNSNRVAASFVSALNEEIRRSGISRVSLKITEAGPNLLEFRLSLDEVTLFFGDRLYLHGATGIAVEWAQVFKRPAMLAALFDTLKQVEREKFEAAHERASRPQLFVGDVLTFEGNDALEKLVITLNNVARSLELEQPMEATLALVQTISRELEKRGVNKFTLELTVFDATQNAFETELQFTSKGKTVRLSLEDYGMFYRDELGNASSVPWQMLFKRPTMIAMLLDASEHLEPAQRLQRALEYMSQEGSGLHLLVRAVKDDDDGPIE